MSTKKPRFTITMDEELFERVETYRFEHRLRSQSQAVVSLVESGIASLLDETKTSPGPAEPGEDVKEFISMVSQLTDEHKRVLLVVIQALIELEQGQPGGSPGKADRTK